MKRHLLSAADLGHDDAVLVLDTARELAALADRWVDTYGEDWRYVVRICNIDVGDLVANSTPPDLITLMTKAVNRIPNLGVGKPVFYCNRTVKTFLEVQAFSAVKAGG